MTFAYDGRQVPYREGESVLIALLRAGLHPTGGGCLCLAGGCPHCLATVDGVFGGLWADREGYIDPSAVVHAMPRPPGVEAPR